MPPGYRAIQADRKDAAAMRAALKGVQPDVVINFLGYDLPDVQMDYELFNGAVRQYVFISSTVVYAKPPRQLPLTEDAPLGNPWWDYAQKKLACEQWLRQRRQETGFPVTIVRPSHTYSKRWVPNPVSSGSYTFAARLEQGKPVFVHDDGESPWTLTTAADFAVGLAGLVGKTEAIGEAFHITSDEVLTWNQIYAEIAAALGVEVPADREGADRFHLPGGAADDRHAQRRQGPSRRVRQLEDQALRPGVPLPHALPPWAFANPCAGCASIPTSRTSSRSWMR